MIYLFYYLLTFVILTYATHKRYAAIMSLKRAKDEGRLTKEIKVLGIPYTLTGYLCDATLNIFFGTVLFLELPKLHKKEWLLSPRVARLQKEGRGYRKKVASYICTKLLDPLDPSGCHCK